MECSKILVFLVILQLQTWQAYPNILYLIYICQALKLSLILFHAHSCLIDITGIFNFYFYNQRVFTSFSIVTECLYDIYSQKLVEGVNFKQMFYLVVYF